MIRMPKTACPLPGSRQPGPRTTRLATGRLRQAALAMVAVAAMAIGIGGLMHRGASIAQAYPEPSIVPVSWQLDFTSEKPRAIAVRDLSGQLRWYWYITYKVTNHSGEDRLFVPEVQIATDQGDLVRAGQDVPTAVFFAIKEKLGNTLLESPNQVVGKILQGDDYARESVAVWPAFSHDIDELSIFVTGLSGESTTVKNPMTQEEVIVRKTRMLTYRVPGDDMNTPPAQQAITPADSQWIMR